MRTLFYLAPDAQIVPLDEATVVERPGRTAVVTNPLQRMILREVQPAPSELSALKKGHSAVEALLQAGLIQELPEPITPTAASLWGTMGLDASQATQVVTAHSVSIEPHHVDATLLQTALAEWAIGTYKSAPSLHVVVVPDALHGTVVEAHARSVRDGTPWVLIVPEATAVWMIAFGLHKSSCGMCLQARLRYNRPVLALGQSAQRTAALSPSLAFLVARFIARLLTCLEETLLRSWTRFDLDGSQTPHPLVPLASCCHCSDGTAPSPRDWLSPVTGVAHSLRTLAAIGEPTATAVRYRFRNRVHTLQELMESECHVAGGKGWEPEAAVRSAIFEAIEHQSGVWRPAIPHRWANARELGHEALLPAEIDLFSTTQQATFSPEGHLSALTIPHALDLDMYVPWVVAKSADGQSQRWYPAAAAFYDVPFEGPRYALATSNGCAAGRSFQDAIRRGLYELIERDAVAIWWYNQVRRPCLDPHLLGEGSLKRFESTLKASRRTLLLFDLTSDIGIPVVAAVSRRQGSPPGWVLGFGAAPSLAEAAFQATAELAQLVPATDDPAQPNPAAWADIATEDDLPHLTRSESIHPSSLSSTHTLTGLLHRLDTLGISVWVIDQTHPDLGVPVVRVVAPGLVHFWRRLGASRLYEVPVKLGWQHQRIDESEMNPLDLTF